MRILLRPLKNHDILPSPLGEGSARSATDEVFYRFAYISRCIIESISSDAKGERKR